MSETRSHLWPGVPLALGSAVLFGASAPLSKLLVGSVDPWLLSGILYLGAGMGLAVIRVGRPLIGLANPEAPLRRSDLPWLGAVMVFGGMLGPVFLMFGLSRTTASSGALLLNLEGLATMASAWTVFRENVDHRLLLGAVAILAGAVLLSWSGDGLRLDIGSLLIAAACLCWGIDNNLTRKLSLADPVQIAMLKGLVAGSANLVLALSLGAGAQPEPCCGGCGGRVPRRRGEPGHVHVGSAAPGHGADWSLFFPGAVHRRGAGHHAVSRAGHAAARRGGAPDGDRPLVAPCGAA